MLRNREDRAAGTDTGIGDIVDRRAGIPAYTRLEPAGTVAGIHMRAAGEEVETEP